MLFYVVYCLFIHVVMLLFPFRLEQMEKEDDSGATATAMFLRNDVLVVSHIGDSCLVPTFLSTSLVSCCSYASQVKIGLHNLLFR
jgi:hypothetical protein